jgi:hypothetical protein
MNEVSQGTRRGPTQFGVEIGVAVATGLFGALVMFGSVQVGIGWGVEGPRAGFFPFYVGLLIVMCSVINLFNALKTIDRTELFADIGQLRSVMSVVIPTAVYVAVMPYVGIYVSSFALIALFMLWIGRYRWALTLAIAIVVPLITYLMFEKWFLVPLPKGPFEEMLGL